MKSIFQKLIGMALISILLASTNVALAATQADIDSNQKKIDEAEEKQKQVESDKTEAMKQVESINSKIDDYETQISEKGQVLDTYTVSSTCPFLPKIKVPQND